METHNKKSISRAAHVTNTLQVKKDAIARLKKYVGDCSQNRDDDQSQDLEWTPCRYSPRGWKYMQKGTIQTHLNSPRKINLIGGFGPV